MTQSARLDAERTVETDAQNAWIVCHGRMASLSHDRLWDFGDARLRASDIGSG
jgi:hypothetical protein